MHRSLPLWECGLKSFYRRYCQLGQLVTPFMGVWIEISLDGYVPKNAKVTPFMGVWIEMYVVSSGTPFKMSLPLWECGLKFIFSGVK